MFTILSLFTGDVVISWSDPEEEEEMSRALVLGPERQTISPLSLGQQPPVQPNGPNVAGASDPDIPRFSLPLGKPTPPPPPTPRSRPAPSSRMSPRGCARRATSTPFPRARPPFRQPAGGTPHTPHLSLSAPCAQLPAGPLTPSPSLCLTSPLRPSPAQLSIQRSLSFRLHLQAAHAKLPQSQRPHGADHPHSHIVQANLTRFSRVRFNAAHRYLGLTTELLRAEKRINELASPCREVFTRGRKGAVAGKVREGGVGEREERLLPRFPPPKPTSLAHSPLANPQLLPLRMRRPPHPPSRSPPSSSSSPSSSQAPGSGTSPSSVLAAPPPPFPYPPPSPPSAPFRPRALSNPPPPNTPRRTRPPPSRTRTTCGRNWPRSFRSPCAPSPTPRTERAREGRPPPACVEASADVDAGKRERRRGICRRRCRETRATPFAGRPPPPSLSLGGRRAVRLWPEAADSLPSAAGLAGDGMGRVGGSGSGTDYLSWDPAPSGGEGGGHGQEHAAAGGGAGEGDEEAGQQLHLIDHLQKVALLTHARRPPRPAKRAKGPSTPAFPARSSLHQARPGDLYSMINPSSEFAPPSHAPPALSRSMARGRYHF
ncbi:hypothetical protein CALVIDRAFT_412146 [Calocera viscosa TUFC12733]|uniref:Uncharacterized protein n=1 Tax=Calocera viscosa (strain TUFC12733) TaxID=1330018 RepID=A0A167G5B6_CALVF|nr:hypothetical protein CALVIDRAFT_412146 [Calocera viscosa TUFC12733]